MLRRNIDPEVWPGHCPCPEKAKIPPGCSAPPDCRLDLAATSPEGAGRLPLVDQRSTAIAPSQAWHACTVWFQARPKNGPHRAEKCRPARARPPRLPVYNARAILGDFLHAPPAKRGRRHSRDKARALGWPAGCDVLLRARRRLGTLIPVPCRAETYL